jgi:hypothetical protein
MGRAALRAGAIGGILGGVMMAVWLMFILWLIGTGFWTLLNLIANTFWRGAPLGDTFTWQAVVPRNPPAARRPFPPVPRHPPTPRCPLVPRKPPAARRPRPQHPRSHGTRRPHDARPSHGTCPPVRKS